MGPQMKMMKSRLDLEQIIQNYAWKCYLCSTAMAKAKKLLIKREKFSVDFLWSFFEFSHCTRLTEVEPEDELLNSVDFGTPNRNLRQSKRLKKTASPGCFYKSVSMNFDEPVALETVIFENNTSTVQHQTISSAKPTTTTLSVEFARNYCLGDVTNIEVDISENDFSSTSQAIVESQTLYVTNTKQQTFVNVSDMDLVGSFNVKPGHVTKATLLSREQTETKTFQVKTTISLVVGCVPVVIRRKSDDKVMFTCFITSLVDLFAPYEGDCLSLVKKNGSYDAIVTSSGRCKLTNWVEPQLMLHSERLQDL